MWKHASKLSLVSLLLLLVSCSVKRAEMPDYAGIGLQDVLSSRSSIDSIEATFSIVLEKDDSEMRGDGALNLLKNGNLSLRIYSLGFLAFEMTALDGIIRSNPPVDRNRVTMLTSGLRDCLFWWDMAEYDIEEDENSYVLQTVTRALRIDKKTLLPVDQTILLDDGRKLSITYANPDCSGSLWYQRKMRIEMTRYAVTILIREISFLAAHQAEINRDRPDDRTVNRFFPGEIPFEKGIVADGVDKPRRAVGVFENAANRFL